MIVSEHLRKIKSYVTILDRKDVYTALCIVFTAIAAYLIGRLSVDTGRTEPVRILSTDVGATVVSRPTPPSQPQKNGAYVGSRNGTKYHLPSCAGARRIAPENQVWFATQEEAETAGYTPASNCPGL